MKHFRIIVLWVLFFSISLQWAYTPIYAKRFAPESHTPSSDYTPENLTLELNSGNPVDATSAVDGFLDMNRAKELVTEASPQASTVSRLYYPSHRLTLIVPQALSSLHFTISEADIAAPYAFKLSAFTPDGESVTQFSAPIVAELDVQNTFSILESDSAQNIPQSSIEAEGKLLIQLDATGDYRLAVQTEPQTCADVGDGVSDELKSLFVQACETAGGLTVIGEIIGSVVTSSTLATSVQSFTNGRLVYNSAQSAVFYLPNAFYQKLIFNVSWLGLPRTNIISTPSMDGWKWADENTDFNTGDFMLFGEAGFAGENSRDGNTVEAHLAYPVVPQVLITAQGVQIGEIPSEDPENTPPTPIVGVQLTAAFDVEDFYDPVDDITTTFIYASDVTGQETTISYHPTTYQMAGPSHAGFANGFEPGTNITFGFAAQRNTPDTLMGYFPCNLYEGNSDIDFNVPYLELGETREIRIDNPCGPGGDFSVPADRTPPTITLVEVFDDDSEDGRTNNIAIVARIEDDRRVANAFLTALGQTIPMTPLEVDGKGNGLYEGILYGVSLRRLLTFSITASDAAGNTASKTFSSFNNPSRDFGLSSCYDPSSSCSSGHFGANGEYRTSIGNPVVTQNGNKVEVLPIVNYAGPGAAEIDFTLTVNSQSAKTGLFGTSVSSPLDMRLAVYKNSLFNGIRVTYPGGNTVNFKRAGECAFEASSRGAYDRLECLGDGYRLTTKTRQVYEFDGQGRLIALADLNSNKTTITYTGDLPASLVSDTGRRLDFVYGTDNLIVGITGTGGKQFGFTYTSQRLDTFTDASGGVWRFVYEERPLGNTVDSFGNEIEQSWYLLQSVITPAGRTKNYQEYDDDGRVVFQRVYEQESRTFIYDVENFSTTIVDSNGHVEIHQHDSKGRLTSVTDGRGFTESYTYTDFVVTGLTDRKGNAWLYTADSSGNRLTATGPEGFSEAWLYNTFNQVTYYRDAAGGETYFEYDSNGNLIKVTNPLAHTHTITRNAQGLPTLVIDFAGRSQAMAYNAIGDLITAVDGTAHATAFTHYDTGLVQTRTNPNGDTYTFQYDLRDNTTLIDGPLGWSHSRQFDADDNLIKEIDTLGGETTYTIDPSARLIQACDPMNRCVGYEYEPMGHIVRVIDSKNRVIDYTLNQNYAVTQIIGPENTRYQMAHDAYGNEISRIDSLNRETRFTYNGLHRVTEITQNYQAGVGAQSDVNLTDYISYDAVGNVTAVTDALNNTTYFTYNPLNQMIVQRDMLGREMHYRYNGVGNVLETRNPRGYATLFGYDANGQLSSITDAKNGVTQYHYDGNRNLTESVNARGVITRVEYNLLNQVVATVENYSVVLAPASDVNVRTTYQNDLLGNVTLSTDARGYTTQYGYNAVSELIETVDRTGAKTTFARDTAGNIVAVTDANNHVYGFLLDDLDRILEEINPEGHKRAYTFDPIGNVLSMTNERGHTETRQYNGADRLIQLTAYNNGIWTQTFDRVGNVLSRTDANGHTSRYEYNAVYEMTRLIDARGADAWQVFDANGNLVEFVDREGNPTRYQFDELDRLSMTQDALGRQTSFGFDAVSNPINMTAPDGIISTYAYDALDRLSAVTENYQSGQSATSSVNVTTAYGYTPTGLVNSITNPNGAVTTFEHDGEGRVTFETDPISNTWQTVFDPVGNPIRRIDGNNAATTYTYYPDNQLRSIAYPDQTGVLVGYDEANNRLSMEEIGRDVGISTWKYDRMNRVMRQVDGLGRILKKRHDKVGNLTAMIYPDQTRVNYEYDENNWLSSVTIPKQGETNYRRNKEGYITRIVYPNSTRTVMTYDAVYQLLSNINTQTSGPKNVITSQSYTYNLAGLRETVNYFYGWRSQESAQVNYVYNGLRRLTDSSDSNGVQTQYVYDPAGNRLNWITNDDPTSSIPFDGFNERFTYNPANQLLQAKRVYGSEIDPTPTPNLTLTPDITTLTPTVEIPTATPSYTPEPPTATFTPEPPTLTPEPTATPAPTLTSLLASLQSYCSAELLGENCGALENKLQQAMIDATNGNNGAVVQHLEGFKHQIEQQLGNQIDTYAGSDLIAQADYLIGIYGGFNEQLVTSEPPLNSAFERAVQSGTDTPTPSLTPQGTATPEIESWRGNEDNLSFPTAPGVGNTRSNPVQADNNPLGYEANFLYDGNGSRIKSHYLYTNGQEYVNDYAYDYERRLTQVDDYQVVGGGAQQERGITSYLYDGLGTRLRGVYQRQPASNQFVTEYLSDGWDVLGEYNPQNGQSTYYFRDDQDRLLSSRDLWKGGKGASVWYHHDGLGSVSALTRHNGNAIHNYRYDSYGAVLPATGNFTEPHNTFTYSGKLMDSETGLSFYGSRYLDPLTGQWMTYDSYRGKLSVPQSLHRMAFVHGNPVNYVDAYGYFVFPLFLNPDIFYPALPQKRINYQRIFNKETLLSGKNPQELLPSLNTSKSYPQCKSAIYNNVDYDLTGAVIRNEINNRWWEILPDRIAKSVGFHLPIVDSHGNGQFNLATARDVMAWLGLESINNDGELRSKLLFDDGFNFTLAQGYLAKNKHEIAEALKDIDLSALHPDLTEDAILERLAVSAYNKGIPNLFNQDLTPEDGVTYQELVNALTTEHTNNVYNQLSQRELTDEADYDHRPEGIQYFEYPEGYSPSVYTL